MREKPSKVIEIFSQSTQDKTSLYDWQLVRGLLLVGGCLLLSLLLSLIMLLLLLLLTFIHCKCYIAVDPSHLCDRRKC